MWLWLAASLAVVWSAPGCQGDDENATCANNPMWDESQCGHHGDTFPWCYAFDWMSVDRPTLEELNDKDPTRKRVIYNCTLPPPPPPSNATPPHAGYVEIFSEDLPMEEFGQIRAFHMSYNIFVVHGSRRISIRRVKWFPSPSPLSVRVPEGCSPPPELYYRLSLSDMYTHPSLSVERTVLSDNGQVLLMVSHGMAVAMYIRSEADQLEFLDNDRNDTLTIHIPQLAEHMAPYLQDQFGELRSKNTEPRFIEVVSDEYTTSAVYYIVVAFDWCLGTFRFELEGLRESGEYHKPRATKLQAVTHPSSCYGLDDEDFWAPKAMITGMTASGRQVTVMLSTGSMREYRILPSGTLAPNPRGSPNTVVVPERPPDSAFATTPMASSRGFYGKKAVAVPPSAGIAARGLRLFDTEPGYDKHTNQMRPSGWINGGNVYYAVRGALDSEVLSALRDEGPSKLVYSIGPYTSRDPNTSFTFPLRTVQSDPIVARAGAPPPDGLTATTTLTTNMTATTTLNGPCWEPRGVYRGCPEEGTVCRAVDRHNTEYECLPPQPNSDWRAFLGLDQYGGMSGLVLSDAGGGTLKLFMSIDMLYKLRPPVRGTDRFCPWASPSYMWGMTRCRDGSFCEGCECEGKRGGISGCPPEKPLLCRKAREEYTCRAQCAYDAIKPCPVDEPGRVFELEGNTTCPPGTTDLLYYECAAITGSTVSYNGGAAACSKVTRHPTDDEVVGWKGPPEDEVSPLLSGRPVLSYFDPNEGGLLYGEAFDDTRVMYPVDCAGLCLFVGPSCTGFAFTPRHHCILVRNGSGVYNVSDETIAYQRKPNVTTPAPTVKTEGEPILRGGVDYRTPRSYCKVEKYVITHNSTCAHVGLDEVQTIEECLRSFLTLREFIANASEVKTIKVLESTYHRNGCSMSVDDGLLFNKQLSGYLGSTIAKAGDASLCAIKAWSREPEGPMYIPHPEVPEPTPSGAGSSVKYIPAWAIVLFLAVLVLAMGGVIFIFNFSRRRSGEEVIEGEQEMVEIHKSKYDDLLEQLVIQISPDETLQTCTVCLEDLVDSCIELSCMHRLHHECMREYVTHQVVKKRRKYPRCPMCRAVVHLDSAEKKSPQSSPRGECADEGSPEQMPRSGSVHVSSGSIDMDQQLDPEVPYTALE